MFITKYMMFYPINWLVLRTCFLKLIILHNIKNSIKATKVWLSGNWVGELYEKSRFKSQWGYCIFSSFLKKNIILRINIIVESNHTKWLNNIYSSPLYFIRCSHIILFFTTIIFYDKIWVDYKGRNWKLIELNLFKILKN